MGDTNWPLRTIVHSYGHLSHEYVANMFAYPNPKRKQALPKVERVNIGHFWKKKMLMWPVVSLTSHDTKKCDTHVYTSFFPPLIRRKQWGNWPNMYAKRLQKLANMTFAKRLVGETTVNPLIYIVCLFCIVSTTRLGGNWRLPTHQS